MKKIYALLSVMVMALTFGLASPAHAYVSMSLANGDRATYWESSNSVDVTDGSCNNGAIARVQVKFADGSGMLAHDLTAFSSGCDNVAQTTYFSKNPVQMRLCSGAGQCTPWKNV